MAAMTRRQRIRRAARLVVHAICNFAAYRGGRSSGRFLRTEPFWIRLNGNFLDVGILEWCKLFADRKDKHYWGAVLTDPKGFERGLLIRLGLSRSEFDLYIREVRDYRDKFVAHLDSDLVAKIPKLDIAVESSIYLLDYLHDSEDGGNFFGGIPADAKRLYRGMLADARVHYQFGHPNNSQESSRGR